MVVPLTEPSVEMLVMALTASPLAAASMVLPLSAQEGAWFAVAQTWPVAEVLAWMALSAVVACSALEPKLTLVPSVV